MGQAGICLRHDAPAPSMNVEETPMKKPSWSALALTLVVAGACSRTIEDKVVEARKAPCTTLCDRKAECPGELPTQAFATKEECFRQCTEAGSTFDETWGRTEESGKDMCFDEFLAQIDCFEALTCEERRTDVTLGTSESKCGWSVSAAGKCARQYKDGGQ